MQIRSGSHSLSSQLALPHAFTLLTVDIFWIQWASETGWTQIILHSSVGMGQWASGTEGTVTPRASLIQLCSLRKFTPNGHALTGPLEFMFGSTTRPRETARQLMKNQSFTQMPSMLPMTTL